MAQVILKNVKKVYEGKVVAVDDFNLKIEDKEFVVLVGPSGCGKSTTLRMVAGLEEITDGWLYIDDRCVNDVAPKDRDIAMVFQNYALYPHLTVYENMAFALKIRKVPQTVVQKRKVMVGEETVEEEVETVVYRKMPAKAIKEKVMAAAELLGITELLERKPKALSGGQRQRVAIGRAIVREPKVFLMDEPLSNLDAKLRNQMRAEIIKLHERINTTFIYVTHDQTEAMTLGDRIVIMKDGFVQQIGTPKQVFQRPSNIFVAGFIGTPQMNMFDAELVKEGGKYVAKLKKATIHLPDYVQEVLAGNNQQPGSIKLGIRPEHIILTNRDDPAGIRSIVDVSEMMGSEYYLHVNTSAGETKADTANSGIAAGTEAIVDNEGARVTSDTIIRIAIVDLPVDKKEGFSVNDEVNFTFDGGLAHLFDVETGENLIYKYVPEEVEDPLEIFGTEDAIKEETAEGQG